MLLQNTICDIITAMNTYDFDKTILKGNSLFRFCTFCTLRLPYMLIVIPELLLTLALRKLRIIKKETFLKMMEVFVLFVPSKQKFVKRFWDKNMKHIKQWYLNVRRDDDVIISASPSYLIEEICSRLGVKCITSVSEQHCLVKQKHCYGEEKVVRFQKEFPNVVPETFYSDSMSDEPMMRFAQMGYLVKGNKITLVFQNGEKVN